jgi:uncharacterized lipoprotein YddW (UPF0748 family)
MQEVQQRIPTGVGIMAGLRTSQVPMRQIKSQVRAAQQRGLGVVFFYYETLWNNSSESLKERLAGFKTLFPYPALRLASE